jgi:hypothetical protein
LASAKLVLGIVLVSAIGLTFAEPTPLTANGSAHANALVTVNDILNRWEPVAQLAGARTASWRDMFATQLMQMSPTFLNIADSVKPGNGNANVEYTRFKQLFVNSQMTAMSTVSKTMPKLASATSDLVFVPIVPCRIVDTRNVGGPIAAGTQVNFYYYDATGTTSWSAQGGDPGTTLAACPGTVLKSGGGTLGSVPPAAAAATVTVVNATDFGNFVVWGGGPLSSIPNTSVLNWSAGQVLANTTVIPWGGRTGGNLDFTVRYNGPSGQADVVVDVVGYFVENTATALQCSTTVAMGSGSVASGTSISVALPACPAGYTMTGGGCGISGSASNNNFLQEASPSNFSRCTWWNNTGAVVGGGTYKAESICCRVPGQ